MQQAVPDMQALERHGWTDTERGRGREWYRPAVKLAFYSSVTRPSCDNKRQRSPDETMRRLGRVDLTADLQGKSVDLVFLITGCDVSVEYVCCME